MAIRPAAPGRVYGRRAGGGAREGHRGPVLLLQADHDQVDAKALLKDRDAEVRRLETIMREQVAAGYYSLDIDASTVVDLPLLTVREQQRLNAELTAHFTQFVRSLEPEGVTISLGAEIGEVGHENTTPEELREFMAVYMEDLRARGKNLVPVSKISINSGTYHGGKMQADGKLAPVTVDRAAENNLRYLPRSSFNMAARCSTAPRVAGSATREVPWHRYGRDPPGARFQQPDLRPSEPAAGAEGPGGDWGSPTRPRAGAGR